MKNVRDSWATFVFIFRGVEFGMDFADLKKTEFFSSKIDKSGLKPGFYPNNHRFINVTFTLFLSCDLNIKFA